MNARSDAKPWDHLSMSPAERLVWEAADRAAAAAPEIKQGDDVALALQRLFPDPSALVAARRAEAEHPSAA